ncbi:MAG: hypothetical protein AAF191_00935 [Verrucomicrobiota bacterium]
MDPVEQSLLQALSAAPDDWGIRLLVAKQMEGRGAADEAAQLISQAPNAPTSDEQLHAAAEMGGVHALGPAQQYVIANPASGYGHQVLANLFEQFGDAEQAAKHEEVAATLLGLGTPAPAHEPVGTPPILAAVADSSAAPPPVNLGLITTSAQPASRRSQAAAVPATRVAQPKQGAGAKVTAILVATGVIAAIILVALVLVILPPSKDEPEIVAAVIGPPAAKVEMQKKNVVKQVKKSSAAAAAAAPVAQLMRANAMAKFSLPKVTKTSTGPLGMGEGNLGSGGFGGTGSGLGTGASFFGGEATGNRFLFIVDHSGSMKDNQVALRNNELERAIGSLKGVQYQVLLFAGGAYFAQEGWSVTGGGNKKRDNTVKDPKGKSYVFLSKGGYSDYEFRGMDSGLPKAEWLPASAANTRATMKFIKSNKLFGGTDWELALRIGHYMDPPPDVIFFMSDGTGGNNPPPILAMNKKRGKPQINTIAMQTSSGAQQFAAVAKGTGGTFIIVDKKGKPIDGFDYLKDPGDFRGRL